MPLSPNDSVIRFFHANQYNALAAEGTRLENSAVTSREFVNPSENNRGPSIFVLGRYTADEIAQIAGKPFHGRIVLPVSTLLDAPLNLAVVHTPGECVKWPSLVDYHYSITGIDSAGKRNVLITIFNKYIERPPCSPTSSS